MTQSLTDFFSAWTMTAEDGRDARIASALADNCSYVDPRTDAELTGTQAITDYVAQFLPMCPPGASVSVADPVDVKLGIARCTVHFTMSEDMRQIGQYFADLDADGKITRLVGFVGKGAE